MDRFLQWDSVFGPLRFPFADLDILSLVASDTGGRSKCESDIFCRDASDTGLPAQFPAIGQIFTHPGVPK